MKFAIILAVCIAVSVPSAPARAAQSNSAEIVVRGSAAPAIRRILEADNLDVERLPADEVAARMREIGRGAAPAGFWIAYQDHVKAWTDYAEAKARARRSDLLRIDDAPDGAAIARARSRINATFDVVEAIAKSYGAWPPRTPTRL